MKKKEYCHLELLYIHVQYPCIEALRIKGRPSILLEQRKGEDSIYNVSLIFQIKEAWKKEEVLPLQIGHGRGEGLHLARVFQSSKEVFKDCVCRSEKLALWRLLTQDRR